MRLLTEFASENEAEMQKLEDEGDALVNVPTTEAKDINALLGKLFEKDYPVVEGSLKLSRAIAELLFITAEYLGEEIPENTPALRAEFEAVFAETSKHVQIISSLAETSKEKSDIASLLSGLTAWKC